MRKIFFSIFVFIAVSIIFTGCFFNSPEGCKGYMKVVNPIPDTTMVLGQTIVRNLKDTPTVFQQTGGDLSYDFTILNQNSFIVLVTIGSKGDMILDARGIGIDTISIQAQGMCDTFAKTTFVVTVANQSSH